VLSKQETKKGLARRGKAFLFRSLNRIQSYFNRDNGNTAASSGIGTGGPCDACFSLVGVAYVGVAQSQLTGAEHEVQPHPQLQ